MSGNMERVLRLMAEKSASDVYMSANTPILIKIHGQILQLSDQLLTPAQIRQLLGELLTPQQMEELDDTGELNVGIGGVLEPLQANPTIIEDNCFVGARSEVVEGVIVEENSVLGMGVYIGQSTPIFDRATGQLSYGRVPAGSVVVSGGLPKRAADGSDYSLYAAVIVKRVDAQTRSKTSINELLRA